MSERKVIQDATVDAILAAKTILRTARSASLSALEPQTGWPLVSRVGLSTTIEGTPVILISELAAHTAALLADGRCSLLIGTVGRGDALAHPRLSIACEAHRVPTEYLAYASIRSRYLAHQPKAELYAGLADFSFFHLEPCRVSFNAGFGRAYALEASDLLSPPVEGLGELEPDAIQHMNEDHAKVVGLYAIHHAGPKPGTWRLTGIDAEGIDIADGDDVRRIWFERPLTSADQLRPVLVEMAGTARR